MTWLSQQGGSLALVVLITCVSGYFDGQGFLHAARIWAGGTLST
jgi:uncharacterized membrane protein YoaK (UPF0700 family)